MRSLTSIGPLALALALTLAGAAAAQEPSKPEAAAPQEAAPKAEEAQKPAAAPAETPPAEAKPDEKPADKHEGDAKPAAKGEPKASPQRPAPPPEVAKVVQLFGTSAACKGTVTGPDGKPAKTRFRMQCKKIARGLAVECHALATAKGMPPYEMTHLIGYDAELKLVRMLSWTSEGEVHDHRGPWRDDGPIELSVDSTMGGQPIKEVLVFTPKGLKELDVKSETTLPDGSKASFQAQCMRMIK